jgi:hypothetical protein
MKPNDVICHGECTVFLSALPTTAKKIETKVGTPVIVADSETTGNHHVVDVLDGVEFYQDGDTKYMVNSVPTNIHCVIADRHDAIVLPPGTYEFGFQQEYDPYTARLNKVRD